MPKVTSSKIEDFQKFTTEYETKAYLREKKQINEQIHSHWRLEVDVNSPSLSLNLNSP